MIYFVAICGAVAALSFTDFTPKLKKIGAIISILLLAMLAGWRTMGGNDFYIYQDIYYGISINYMSSEIGYAVFNNLFSGFGFSYNAFLFCYSLVAITLLVLFLQKHTKYPSFALLFYIACYFFFYNMVLNRQMICMSLALWVIYWWNNNNKILSIISLLIGVTFHQSLLVLLPFLLIYDVLSKINKPAVTLVFFVSLIAFCVLVPPINAVQIIAMIPGLSFIGTRVLGYLTNSELSSYTLNIVEYIKMAMALIIILPFIKKILADKKNRIWLFLYLIGLVFIFWTKDIQVLFRIFAYFDLSLLVLLPLCVGFFVSRFQKQQQGILLLLIYAAMGLLALGSILYRTHNFENAVFWQYTFYFWGI